MNALDLATNVIPYVLCAASFGILHMCKRTQDQTKGLIAYAKDLIAENQAVLDEIERANREDQPSESDRLCKAENNHV